MMKAKEIARLRKEQKLRARVNRDRRMVETFDVMLAQGITVTRGERGRFVSLPALRNSAAQQASESRFRLDLHRDGA